MHKQDKFSELLCNNVFYDRKSVLKEIEEWMRKNIIMTYGRIHVTEEKVDDELFKFFNIEEHYPFEYKERDLNGVNFLCNILIEIGNSVGVNQTELKYLPRIKDLEKQIEDLTQKNKELNKQVKELSDIKKKS